MQGTQSQLNFLPEKHTDFIFTMFAEEMGFIGSVSLLMVYLLVLLSIVYMAVRCRSQFARLVAAGVGITLFVYVFINVAMVMGLVPVVGVPLPLVSYGGTSMITLMFGFGLVLNAHVHRRTQPPPPRDRRPLTRARPAGQVRLCGVIWEGREGRIRPVHTLSGA